MDLESFFRILGNSHELTQHTRALLRLLLNDPNSIELEVVFIPSLRGVNTPRSATERRA